MVMASNASGLSADQYQTTLQRWNKMRARLRADWHEHEQRGMPVDAVEAQLRSLLGAKHLGASARSGIFLNYHRSDEIAALEIAMTIREQNVSLWMDVLDIEDYDDWEYQVTSALTKSQMMMILLSPEAVQDDDFFALYQKTYQAGKVLLPIKVESCDHQRFRFDLPVIDVRQDADTQIQKLLDHLEVYTH
jgi:hypothetical protein